jgi:AcrR family transcriptional regulator
LARQAAATKRPRRERGSINAEDIINGAFELAADLPIDTLSMPVLAKHLGVGVTSIYWYFRRKEELLDAMTDRALGEYEFATPFVKADNWRDSLAGHAREMRQTFRGSPILCDLILIRGTLGPERTHSAIQNLEQAVAALVDAGLTPEDAFDTYSAVSLHVRGSVVLERLQDKNRMTRPPRESGGERVIDPAKMPLMAEITRKGHRIGVADDINFEYGLRCILDHAERAIAENPKPKKARR